VTIPKDQPMAGVPKEYRGASLAAMEKAAGKKGYRLVLCDPTGVNAFFLRNDVAPDVRPLGVTRAFRSIRDRSDLTDDPLLEDTTLTMSDLPLGDV
jgi:hypothetical protein